MFNFIFKIIKKKIVLFAIYTSLLNTSGYRDKIVF